LLRRSLAVFDELRQSVREIEFLADPNAGELRVASTEVLAAGLLPAAIDRLTRQYPCMTVRTAQGSFSTVLEFLRDRRYEVAVARLLSSGPDLDLQPLHYEQPFVVVGSRSKWARQRRVKLADLAGEAWIQSPPEMEPVVPLKAFHAAGVPRPCVVVFSGSLNMRYGLLASGRFITMIPDSALHYGPRRAAIRILPIKLPRWHVPTCVVPLKGRTLSQSASTALRFTR
jgi:DNA-binding transcriptional LysR family regulator